MSDVRLNGADYCTEMFIKKAQSALSELVDAFNHLPSYGIQGGERKANLQYPCPFTKFMDDAQVIAQMDFKDVINENIDIHENENAIEEENDEKDL